MTVTSDERVVVGVDGSPESAAALREAADQARCRRARLCVVYVGRRRRNLLARLRNGRHVSHADALAIVDAMVSKALGVEAEILALSRHVAFGRPGPSLVGWAWRDNDLLVVGSRRGRGRRVHRLARRSVSRYCAARAHGPLLIVRDARPVLSETVTLPRQQQAPTADDPLKRATSISPAKVLALPKALARR